MKHLIIFSIFLLISTFLLGQDQLYKGPYKWKHNYIYYAGEATYHYSTGSNSERIYNGEFSFKGNIERDLSAEDERFTFITNSEYFGDEQQTFTMCQPKLISINGSFNNGKRIGQWVTLLTGSDNNQSFVKTTYENGKLNGPFEINLNVPNGDRYNATGQFKNNLIYGALKIDVLEKLDGQKHLYKLNTFFDEEGFFDGNFKLEYDDLNKVPYQDSRVYKNGSLVSIVISNLSNGEILFSNSGSFSTYKTIDEIIEKHSDVNEIGDFIRRECAILGLQNDLTSEIPDELAKASMDYVSFYKTLIQENNAPQKGQSFYHYPLACYPFIGGLNSIEFPQIRLDNNQWMKTNYSHINSDLFATIVPNIDKIPNIDNVSKFNSSEQLQLEILYKKMIAPLNDLEQLNIGAAKYLYYPVKAPVIYHEELYKKFTNYVYQKRIEDSTKTVSQILKILNDANAKMKVLVDSINQPILYTIQEINKNPDWLKNQVVSLEKGKEKFIDFKYLYEETVNDLENKYDKKFDLLINQNTFYNEKTLDSIEQKIEEKINVNNNFTNGINEVIEVRKNLLSALEIYKPKDYASFVDLEVKMLLFIESQKNLLNNVSFEQCSAYYTNLYLFYHYLMQNLNNLKIKKMDSWEELLSIMKSNGFTSTYFDKSN
ncbi:MAG: hypothetical protein RIT10_342 [Bacteroidota bacterium]|jgi:hypothetical protein